MTPKIPPHLTGNAIRKTFIDYFRNHEHTIVPSASLVPGGDSTLLFTNSGMVQFKDVFIGTDKRPYSRAVNSQKSMRVAGKHNDLDDVGRDDTHHTFFEMLGNWSFGDYYKKEAIEWAWHLLTEVWGLPKSNLYATVFKDDIGDIPTDEEAATHWRAQPGFGSDHVFYMGRKDNFWEMAETGPCGPCSEIHIDFTPELGPPSPEDFDTDRFLELWNLVFIQYNRLDEVTFKPLPATHVDTGMGFERIVAVLQGVSSNYRTDLFWPLIQKTQELTGQSDAEREANFTPYRVIADHTRAATFLIADGVIPGNLGRNYITRMIIRRAYRFGGKIGLIEPFMAPIAKIVIANYGEAYPELVRHQKTILATITREEEQFQRTLDKATSQLEQLLDGMVKNGEKVLSGELAADLYTTHGMPLEITRDIARERSLDVDEKDFQEAMQAHRLASGAGTAIGTMGSDDTELYADIMSKLTASGELNQSGVAYHPYGELKTEGKILALTSGGLIVDKAHAGDFVDVILPETSFYIEAGGQVSDSGKLTGSNGSEWQIRIDGVRRPAAGIIAHFGEVITGTPKVGDKAIAAIDETRRKDIMRNHTATHLLHAALDEILGEHARQAGSLVAPDRLRFDFTHPEAVTPAEIEKIEFRVNQRILENHKLNIVTKPLKVAISEGARALFGEKYEETVRTIRMGEFSYELCGGTHVEQTGDIGLFIITSEGSAAAGIRRIEAITGRKAVEHVQKNNKLLTQTARLLGTGPDQIQPKVESLLDSLTTVQKELAALKSKIAAVEFSQNLDSTATIKGVQLLTAKIESADSNTLRQMADRFRQKFPANAVAIIASVIDERPMLVAVVTDDLVPRGLHAGNLVKYVAQQVGGGGGGRPTMAQAGGKDAKNLDSALGSIPGYIEANLK